MSKISYGEALCHGFEYLMGNYPEVFTIGQGLWAPWYVGTSMKDLDKKFGRERVIDSPISESACTGAAIGAALCGYRPVVIHPRMDFMILAIDQIVTQAAKWSHMFGGKSSCPVTIRGIINRGGEQGAQHSQALHSWFAHIPGLRVVMPATASDARDLLIASVLCDDPVMFIDDRWLYSKKEELGEIKELNLADIKPQILKNGDDITLVSASYSTKLCLEAANSLKDISAEVIDLRVINPLDISLIVESVKRTKRLCVVDGGWTTCGLAGEIIASVCEKLPPNTLLSTPSRVTLVDAPAPTSSTLEAEYFPTTEKVISAINQSVS